MKILQIHPSLSPGGIEAMICNLSNYMSNLGHEVTVCSIFAPRDTDVFWFKLSNNIHKVSLWKKKCGLSLKSLMAIFYLIKKGDFNVVHIHGFLFYYYLPILFFHNRVKFIYTVHSDAVKENSLWDEKLFFIKKLFFKLNWISPITISETSRSSFKRLYGFDAKLVPNGIPKPSIHNMSNLVDSYRIDSETKVFIHPGRITEAKNQLVLCQVFNRLIEEGYNVVLLIVGEIQNKYIYNDIETFFSSRIRYIGARDDIPFLMSSADGFCLPSIWEGLPITLLEALSVGCIPICSPVGGIVDVITDGKDGILSKTSCYSDYYNAMIRMLSLSEEKIIRIKKECLRTFLKYDITVTASSYLMLYGCS